MFEISHQNQQKHLLNENTNLPHHLLHKLRKILNDAKEIPGAFLMHLLDIEM